MPRFTRQSALDGTAFARDPLGARNAEQEIAFKKEQPETDGRGPGRLYGLEAANDDQGVPVEPFSPMRDLLRGANVGGPALSWWIRSSGVGRLAWRGCGSDGE
jgi:hypothetical protein